MEVKRAIFETLKAALGYTVFCLFAMTVFAAIVKAAMPNAVTVKAVSWIVKCVGMFLSSLLFIRRGRAVFKGMAAGVLGSVLAMLAFAAIGGGFHVSLFFLLEIFVLAVLGGVGALAGAKLTKER